MATSNVTLRESPHPYDVLFQVSEVFHLAFSNGEYLRWMSKTPADALTDKLEKIPGRVRQYATVIAHRLLNPRVVMVCAFKDDRVVGYAMWRAPRALRQETVFQMVYRKAVQAMDCLEKWLSPPTWRNNPRFIQYWKTVSQCADTAFDGNPQKSWYLMMLAVLPECQRQQIGGRLMDWALDIAKERGEKAYTESSEAGRALYSKKGFQVVDYVFVRDQSSAEELAPPFMVWDPNRT